MSRHELHGLVRNLRQYLEWQGVALAASVPASSAERREWEEARRARAQAKLDRALSEPSSPVESSPERTAPETEPRQAEVESPAAAALWKDDSFDTRPRKTFAEDTTLAAVREELGECTRCALSKGRTNIVFGVGNPDARLMFVGEAPGEDEDAQGEPFVGKAGALLDKMIEAMTLRREDVYIANVLKCRPPNNRDPEPVEVATCSPFLKKQIAAIKPEVIVATGKFASNLLTGNDGALGRIRGKWHEYEGVPLMPTYHPAYLLRSPSQKKAAWADLLNVMVKLGIEIPAKYR